MLRVIVWVYCGYIYSYIYIYIYSYLFVYLYILYVYSYLYICGYVYSYTILFRMRWRFSYISQFLGCLLTAYTSGTECHNYLGHDHAIIALFPPCDSAAVKDSCIAWKLFLHYYFNCNKEVDLVYFIKEPSSVEFANPLLCVEEVGPTAHMW